jgi:hypothetical protein
MAPTALLWLYHNRSVDRKQAGNGLLQLSAPAAADQENSSGGLKDRWIAMGPVRTLVHLVVLIMTDNPVSRATIRSTRHRNIVLALAES